MKKALITLSILLAFSFAHIAADEKMQSITFVVPRNFEPAIEELAAKKKATMKSMIEDLGISFSEEASAVFDANNSELTVRQSPGQMVKIDALVNSINPFIGANVKVSAVEIRTSSPSLITLLKDRGLITDDSKTKSILHYFNRAALINQLSRPPTYKNQTSEPRVSGISKVISKSEFDILFRAFDQFRTQKNIKTYSIPEAAATSGNPVLISMDERRYGIIPKVASDGKTISLELLIPSPGKALDISPESTDEIVVEGEQRAVWFEMLTSTLVRLVFVGASLEDG